MLLAAVGMAFLVPEPGAKGGWLRSDLTVPLGAAALFFIQGLLIPFDHLRRGMLRLHIHGLLQLWIFVGMPMLVAICLYLWPQAFPEGLRLGFLFMAFLPTTVSTAVIFASASGGDAAITLFNTTLSNLIGVFWVPLVCTLIVVSAGVDVALGGMLMKIGTLILLPFALGQFLRALFPGVRSRVVARKEWIGSLCTYLILYIVYCSFADSVQSAFWQGQENKLVFGVLALCLIILLLSKVMLWFITGGLGCARDIRLTFLFCGSQKTLVAGIPLAQSIFGNGPFDMGLLLMPILFYHILQLFIGGILVNRFSRRI